MAASFKIPISLKGKAKKDPELPKFDWKPFEKEKKLGCGTFGSVYLGKYKGKPEKVVTKKINVESIDSKSRFVKEAALLNSTKGHRNIIRFLEFCKEPLSNVAWSYSCFDFRPFGIAKSLCTLEDFVQFVDDEFDFAPFADLLPTCAKDVVEGLKYLHSKTTAGTRI
jgi:serine/threonine protein kinase